MMQQVHGHEVLKMMIGSGKTYTKQSLILEITQRFGKDTRFHTCSAENLTAEQLIVFLDSNGKLVHQQSGFQTSPDLMCQD
jgi:probable metal-binding protein